MKQARDIFRFAPAATPTEVAETPVASATGSTYRRSPNPPDTRHDWLSVPEAADLLGRSRQAIHVRLNRGKLPYTISDGRRWVRRDLLELVERAHQAQRSRQL